MIDPNADDESMGATIHNLFPGSEAAAAAPMPSALAGELRSTCLELLDRLIQQMFDRADDALFEMGEKAANDTERRRYLDTLRVLRLDRSQVLQAFAQRFAAGFEAPAGQRENPDTDEPLELSIQSTEELEERIALGNLAAKVESRYQDLIYELGRRWQAAHEQGLVPASDPLSPHRICQAFGAAAGALATSFEIKLIVYKLFDRLLTQELGSVYQTALDLFIRHGFAVLPAASTRPAAVRRAAAQRLREHGLDPQQLRDLGDPAAGRLADLVQRAVEHGDAGGAESTAERLSMAVRLFENLLAQPHLDIALRSAFEPLRYPLYQRALVDPALLASATHPLRTTLSALVDLAAATQTGQASSSGFRAALSAVLGQTQFGAVSADVAGADRPLDWERFLDELRAQSEARRAALLQQIRRLVGRELDLRIVGRVLPAPVLALLRSGLGPLLAVRLLRNGRGSPEYTVAAALLDRVVASFDAEEPAPEAARLAREPLVEELVAQFRQVGLPEVKIDLLIGGLRGSYRERDRQADRAAENGGPLSDAERRCLTEPYTGDAPESPPSPATADGAIEVTPAQNPQPIEAAEWLPRILLPETWFRVFDPATGETRWLRLASFYLAQDSLSFTGFDAASRLSLRLSRFVGDLVLGRSEPINPTPDVRAALDALRGAAIPEAAAH